MKVKKVFIYAVTVIMLLSMTITAFADDGIMFRRNISKTPEQETERAAIGHMTFYVPAQSSDGTLLTEGIEYYIPSEIEAEADGELGDDVTDGILVDTRYFAKPLISVYIDGLPEEETKSGTSFGAHDAYAALSLDDGTSWKRSNLSNSADLSSFTLANGLDYPGDAHNMTFAIAGDRVLVGWISKYCDGGLPAYTMVDEDDVDGDGNTTEKLYPDIWGVAGSQKSVDYTLQGYPEVGEIPYSCVWSARGKLLPVELEDGSTGYDIIWTKAERLTSGRRDANRLEMNGDSSTGFMMVWQEDPEGLRPGQGLGPGEGWSGAVVNGQTDLWYSAISNDDFDKVWSSDEDDATPVVIDEYDYNSEDASIPKVVVPMALPVRLTDNKMCKASGITNSDGTTEEANSNPYCYIDFSTWVPEPADVEDLPSEPLEGGASTLCADSVSWETPGGAILELCVAQDGRIMQGRVGASRPRVNVQPYDLDGDGIYDSSWVILGAEESKALGDGAPEETGGGQPDEEEPIDIGKNMWYYSFDMLNPAVVQQGGMLNWPARCNPNDVEVKGCTLGDMMVIEDPLYTENTFYETEISRRFSHMSQPIHQIGDEGISSVLIVKQGILNQGGPADIFLRMTQVPSDVWVECPVDSPYEKCLPAGYNPYAYENMQCDEWAFQDGSNPRYVEGLCLSAGINVSGGSIVSCSDGSSGEDCAAAFPWEASEDETKYPKVTEWVQTVDNLDDESWENPYDVAKGHRGFIDGDFIMMMYAWSPNWKANSVGNDHYNLYARRSFDGGLTWTTTPAALGGDGTETCENFGTGEEVTTKCTTYGAGEFEQARNLSQLTGNKVTILDPRYSPTGGIKMLPITDKLGVGDEGELPYWDDAVRDPSKFFIVYETGDNTTVDVGEAVPLDLFYSRAFNWGDDYDLVEYETGDGETIEGFDWLEHDRENLSGEASNTANAAGTYYYVVWNQWQEDEHENVFNSDIWFRRLYFDEDNENAPATSLIYTGAVMQDTDNEIILVATARDFDRLGDGDEIVEFEWSVDGVVDPDQKGNRYNAPPRTLSIGWHGFSVRAKDNDGHWSKPAGFEVYVAEDVYNVHIPITISP